MSKQLKRILCILLTIICITTSVPILANASTVTTKGEATISPTKKQLNGAKSPKYSSSSVTISGKIKKSFNMDIYHFEAPAQGYYAIYTTGLSDTVGAVYEHQNFLWWTTEYKRIAYNDDGCKIDRSRNFSMVVKLDKGEDYYICVRTYGKSWGSYKLIIEPNEDKTKSENGGMWTSQKLDDSSMLLNCYVSKKQYFTKEQALLNYLLLENEDIELPDGYVVNFDTIYATYQESVSEAMEILCNIIDYVCAIPKVPEGVSITASMVGSMIQMIYSCSTDEADDLADEIKATCDIKQKIISISGKGAITGYTIAHGLLRTTMFNGNSLLLTSCHYSAYDSTILKGEKYCYGKWN